MGVPCSRPQWRELAQIGYQDVYTLPCPCNTNNTVRSLFSRRETVLERYRVATFKWIRGISNICLSLFVHRWYSFTNIISIVCTRLTSPSAQHQHRSPLITTTLHHMKGSIFVLRRNYGTVTPQDIIHTVRNIGKVQRFVDYDFEEHDWAIVI